MSQLSSIAGALSGPPSGHLVALHQLNEILVATDGARVGAILPYVVAALGEAAPGDGDFGGESEIAVLCVRAITNIVDMDPQACRYLARPSSLAVLQLHLVPGGLESEVCEAVCKLLAVTAVQYAQSVLRSGALAAALAVFSNIPAARLAVLQTLLHACEKVRRVKCVGKWDDQLANTALYQIGGREEAALLLDLLPTVLSLIDASIDRGSFASCPIARCGW